MRVVVVGLVGHALFMAFNQPLLYQGNVGLLSVASLLATAVNVGLNLALIPRLGILGAAVATAITYLALAALALVLTNAYSPIRWRRATLVGGGCAAVVAGLLGCGLPALAPWATVLVKASIISVLALVVVRLHARASKFTSERSWSQDSSASCSAYSKSSQHC
jgi:O-antigen/teichoic acid export membrane protein